ncbi:hypothetical protein VHEMI04418 [[Torrubiella] hemipterigena]|uniref:ABC transporter domain-containing protein n=1 Tax=[Torrubiella] hemipterigena TaxID=1531966 RepID=A0A0A1SV71_9HYPO|nr:hypothetical protein VHEMI04418 [[Torrubiella] hemipterigena]
MSSSAGRVLLCGNDVKDAPSYQYLGVGPQHDALDLMGTGQHLEFYARIKGVQDVRSNVEYLMNRLDLAAHAKTQAGNLSGGNKRKLSLAIALMGKPPVVVLDEPTTAIDAIAKRAFWCIVEDIVHDHSILPRMEETERLANRTAIMASRMLAISSTAHLRTKYGRGYCVSLSLQSGAHATNAEMQRVFSFFQQKMQGRITLERDMVRGQIWFVLAPSTHTHPHSPTRQDNMSTLFARLYSDYNRPAKIERQRLMDNADLIMPEDAAWAYYQKLVSQQELAMLAKVDMKAFVIGLESFPNLRRVIITPLAHGLIFAPGYETPMIRAFPEAFNYSMDTGSVSCEFVRDKWRGYRNVTRSLAEYSHLHHVTKLIVEDSLIRVGLNINMFEAPNQDYSNLVKIVSRPGFQRLDSSLITGGEKCLY